MIFPVHSRLNTILFLSDPECLQGLELEGMKGVVCGSSCAHVHVRVCAGREKVWLMDMFSSLLGVLRDKGKGEEAATGLNTN